MKKHLFLALSLLLCMTAGAQRLGVREEVRADWNKSSGLDCLLDLSPKTLTPVPKGYEAVYISHYIQSSHPLPSPSPPTFNLS